MEYEIIGDDVFVLKITNGQAQAGGVVVRMPVDEVNNLSAKMEWAQKHNNASRANQQLKKVY